MSELRLFEETEYLDDLLAIERDMPDCVRPYCSGWGLWCGRQPELAALFDRSVDIHQKVVYDPTKFYDAYDLPADAPRPSVPDRCYTLTPKNGLLLCLENEYERSSWALLQKESYIFLELLSPTFYHATLEWDQGSWRIAQLLQSLRARNERKLPRFEGALSMERLFIPPYQAGRVSWDSSKISPKIKNWADDATNGAIAIHRETPPFSVDAKTEAVALIAYPALAKLFVTAPGVLEAAQMVIDDALAMGLSNLSFAMRLALAFLRREVAIATRLLEETGVEDVH